MLGKGTAQKMLGHQLKVFETLTVDHGFVNDSAAQVQAQNPEKEKQEKRVCGPLVVYHFFR
jgi:hypothetical protein